MYKVLIIAAGGAVGALGRAGLAVLVQRALGPRFPWGTLCVNLVGCLLFGLVWALTEGRGRDLTSARLFLLTGFMGAFTTFSTFAYDTVELGHLGKVGAAWANVALHNGLGLACVVLGLALGRAL